MLAPLGPRLTASRLALTITAALALAAIAPRALAQSLEHRIETIIERSGLKGATIGVAVMEIDTGQLLAAHNAEEPLIPASNMKLLTSGAALLTLGEDFTFRTELLRHADETGSRLILRGSGDPALGDPVLLDQGTPPLDIDGLLDRMAGAARRAGVTGIDEVVVDARIFDTEPTLDSWPTDQLNRWYCAEISGLNLHTNVVTFYVAASDDGLPDVTLVPAAPWLEISNRSRSVSRGQSTIWIARPRPVNTFTIYGNVRGRHAVRAAIADPPDFAGRVLSRTLHRGGITAAGAPAPVRHAEAHETFAGAAPVVIVTTSLTDVLERCNVDSHNLYAEALIKRIGHEVTGEPGSWSNGAAVLRMLIGERLGPADATSTTIVDGSGLSRDNRITPQTLTAWLMSIARDPEVIGPYIESIPTPGEGTLRSRFKDKSLYGEVRAKSGYLRGVYALSGYVLDPRTREPEVAFSILLNDVPEGSVSLRAKPLHEDIVEAIDGWLERRQRAATPDFGG